MPVAEHPIVEEPDVMSIEQDSEFALNLWTLISKHRLHKIVETGAYLATGTTAIIASALSDLMQSGSVHPSEVCFYTIEANKEYIDVAWENLKQMGFDKFVHVLHGLSIPRPLLPTPAEIKRWTVDELPEGVAADHDPSDRVYRYYAETADETIPDKRLEQAVKMTGSGPDLLLLDSAGSMGLQEFQYAISLVREPCFITMDDIFHVKHFRSLKFMLDDPRFDIRCLGREKYGFCIAHFTP